MECQSRSAFQHCLYVENTYNIVETIMHQSYTGYYKVLQQLQGFGLIWHNQHQTADVFLSFFLSYLNLIVYFLSIYLSRSRKLTAYAINFRYLSTCHSVHLFSYSMSSLFVNNHNHYSLGSRSSSQLVLSGRSHGRGLEVMYLLKCRPAGQRLREATSRPS